MQKILHKNPNIHPLFNDIEYLYHLTSVKSTEKTLVLPQISDCFKDTINIFTQYSNAKYDVNFVKKHYDRIKVPKASKKIIVCFSGGKDSTAAALYYKNLDYDVKLYHLKGINKTYKDEYKAAKQVAKVLKMDLIFDEVELKGNQMWIEHPLKNWIIAERALQYALINNLSCNIAFGNFSSSTLQNDPFDVCGGDSAEMWRTYEKIIRQVIPRYKISIPLENMQDTIDLLVDCPNVLKYTQSCIGAYRYREYLRINNIKKFNIKLPEHRCGSCWKCCLEYCIFCDYDIYEYNEEYYKHCLKILRNTLKKENNIRCRLEDVWDYYFFYDKERSKYFG